MATPNIGEMMILATAKAPIAPIGMAFQAVAVNGILSLARADPKQMRPRGTLAAPTKVQVSMMNASGG